MNIKKIIFKRTDLIVFFDDIFYWLWRVTPSKGFPDRSFVLLTIMQLSYALFVVSLIIIAFPIRIKFPLYESSSPIAGISFMIFIVLLIFNSNLYDEKRYQKLSYVYKHMSNIDVEKRKKKFHLFILITIIVYFVDIILLL